MNLGFLYATVTFICSVSILIVWLRVHALSDRLRVRKSFLALLNFFILFTLLDTMWGISSTQIFTNNRLLLTITTYLFHIGAAISAFWWAGFICSFLDAAESVRKTVDTVRIMLFSVQVILLAANLKTNFAFYYDSDCTYVTLRPRNVMYQLQFCYYIFIMGFSTVKFLQSRNPIKKGRFAGAIFFSAIPFLFGIGQMKYPDIPFYSLGFMTLSVAIYLTTITRARESDEQVRETLITSLADDYEAVSLANLDADTIEIIKTTDSFREKHKDNTETTFSLFNQKAAMYVYPEDRKVFSREMTPENIRQKLNAQKSFYVSYRQYIDNTILFYRIKVLRTDNWEDDSEFIVGTSNVDDLIRKQISLTEENTRKTSVLNTLAGSYESVCYINLENLTYIPYFGSDNLKQWYRTDSFRNDFSAYIRAKVAPEHQATLLSAVTKESFAKYREEAEVGNSAFLTQQFLVDINGVQTWCEFSLSHIDDTHIIAAIQNRDAIIRSESEQKHILAEAKEKAEAASKAKTTFLFNMSHDIRTPMNAVHGFIELAERNLDDRDKLASYLAKAKTSGEHLLKLINDILDMSRIESGKVAIETVPTDISVETSKLVAILDASAKEKGINFTTDISSIRNNYIYSDILHVNQILLNIVSNAIKYTKPGGSVSLTIMQLLSTNQGKSSYCFQVKDTGVGMSSEYLEHIFEEFSRAKNSTQSGIEGTGLGMAIVKRLVDMMGGDIEIESKLGKGTVVQIYLSFDIADKQVAVPVKNETQERSLTGKRILLVEDNELNREIARDILEYEGIIIEEAEDGAIAVEKVREHTPDYYDYVLMDIQMPYMNGYQASHAIRNLDNADYSLLPIIAMTANAFEDDIRNALEAGMNGHLSKPINVPVLLQCLREYSRPTADKN